MELWRLTIPVKARHSMHPGSKPSPNESRSQALRITLSHSGPRRREPAQSNGGVSGMTVGKSTQNPGLFLSRHAGYTA